MTEAMAVVPGFPEKERRALRMAGERSYSRVRESGVYLKGVIPQDDADHEQEFWDIAVYEISRKKKPSDAVVKALQARNKKLDPSLQLSYEDLQEIKDLAYTYTQVIRKYDDPDDEDEKVQRRLPYFEKDGSLYLTCISSDDQYSYAHLKDGKVVFSEMEPDPTGCNTVPPELPVHQDRGTTMYIVGIPERELLETTDLLSPGELYARIRGHLYRYLDARESDYEQFVYYALYSWYFSKFSTTPYLRFLGDTGKGKSRFLKVVSDLCFYPIKASGSSSLSGIMRFKERWMGTLLIDESDLKGDQSDPMIKYLNLGFEKDNPFLLTDKNDLSKPQIFDSFGPKLIAMRQPFHDAATEGRCLSFSPYETTREDIPPELPSRYADEVAELRSLIARFTLEHWNEVSEDCMLSCSGMRIEGRIKQMARPLTVILTLFPDGKERFMKYLNERQREIRQTRAESMEGMMFNYVLQLALGEEDPIEKTGYGDFYIGSEIQGVIPRMVADMMKCSTKRVTQSLESIGMEVRQKRLARANGTRNTRVLLVPDEKKWQEMVQRYYVPEDGEEILICPECLKGPEYGTRQQLFSESGALSSSVLRDEGLGEETGDEKVVQSSFETLQEWLSYHGFDQALPVEQYVLIPHEDRAGLFCRCKGCQEPGRSRPMYGILERPYNQICQKHYDEMRGLSSDPQSDELLSNP